MRAIPVVPRPAPAAKKPAEEAPFTFRIPAGWDRLGARTVTIHAMTRSEARAKLKVRLIKDNGWKMRPKDCPMPPGIGRGQANPRRPQTAANAA